MYKPIHYTPCLHLYFIGTNKTKPTVGFKTYHNTIDRLRPYLIRSKVTILIITPTNLIVILRTNNQTLPMSRDQQVRHQQATLVKSPCRTMKSMTAPIFIDKNIIVPYIGVCREIVIMQRNHILQCRENKV